MYIILGTVLNGYRYSSAEYIYVIVARVNLERAIYWGEVTMALRLDRW